MRLVMIPAISLINAEGGTLTAFCCSRKPRGAPELAGACLQLSSDAKCMAPSSARGT